MLPALICLCVAYVGEPDIWWHISSGDWVLQHHAFPQVDSFSSTTMGRPWQAYSWLFEVLVSNLFARFGLAGIVGYTSSMVLLITTALFFLVHDPQKSLRVALPLTLAGSLAVLTLYSPRPWHFSILLFVLELAIIQNVRRGGTAAKLLWLPAIFSLWANLHIQFVDGLLLLLLVAVESIFVRSNGRVGITRISATVALATLAGCVAATLLNPYGWHIYTVAHDLAAQHGVVNSIEELKAMPFRAPSNYLVLLLTVAAGAALALRRSVPFFDTVLLIASAALSFRSQRDIWLVVSSSIVILAQGSSTGESERPSNSSFTRLLPACAFAALLLVGAAHLMKLSDRNLQPKLQTAMPVQAVAFLREQGTRGPVFCDFIWGGFLMHSLSLPVSIDGRAALHGDEQLERSAHTWAGAPDWATDPQLASAGVVVAPRSAALTQLLRTDSRFDRVYEDKIAAVFVPHGTSAAALIPLH